MRNLYLVVFGGATAGSGGFVMHFLGMFAQRSTIKMTLSPWYVLLTVFLAVIIESSGFWIIFRLVRMIW